MMDEPRTRDGRLSGLRPGARQLARVALDLLLPPQCLACDAVVAEPGRLCARCFGQVDMITDPMCAICGLPFDIAGAPDRICGACLADRPPFTRSRSAARYDDRIRDALLGFKHGDRADRAAGLARLVARAGHPWLGQADLITGVPLHRYRLLRRRYNQAVMIADVLARGVPGLAIPDLMLRTRATRTQGGLSGSARRRNLRAAFAINPAHAALVRGRHVVLVDDVITTGATVSECAKVLRRAGAAEITVLAVARVVRTGHTTYV
ncbi:MAG: ComF family protein [Minwuia sp.]|nr:ComF family protein [Minwuia sp.]